MATFPSSLFLKPFSADLFICKIYKNTYLQMQNLNQIHFVFFFLKYLKPTEASRGHSNI
jgi:hypothetical protein